MEYGGKREGEDCGARRKVWALLEGGKRGKCEKEEGVECNGRMKS